MTTNTQTECWCFESISECCCYEDCRMQVRRCCRCDQDIIRVVKVWMNKNNNKDKDTVEWEKGELLLQLPSSISAQRKFVFVVRIFLAIFSSYKNLRDCPLFQWCTRIREFSVLKSKFNFDRLKLETFSVCLVVVSTSFSFSFLHNPVSTTHEQIKQ